MHIKMKKIFFSMLAVLGICMAASAQITLTVVNNTPQFFLGTIVDYNWNGATPGMNFDIPVSMTSVHWGIQVQSGAQLAATTDWRGICLRAYPSMLYYFPVYFPTAPYAGTITGLGGAIPYNIDCMITGPSDILISFTP
jgi:hypothetical protein